MKPDDVVRTLFKESESETHALVEQANNEGWNWEECGYLVGKTGLTQEQLWMLVKMSRTQDRQEISLRDASGRPFSFRLPPSAQRTLHLIDTYLGGMIQNPSPLLDAPSDRQRYLITALMEEAIASSQLEGAAVTRDVAKKMLLTGREPRNSHERMILNNYQTIRMLNGRRSEILTIPLLHEIQSQLTDRAIDKPDACGRFRNPKEEVVVWDEEDQQPLHTPPAAAELPQRVEALCDFANGKDIPVGMTGFVHPAVRAMLLHFWLAYDHPYVDGNGRTARALFYWSMLRSGYWLVEYLTISSIIRNQPKEYGRAFLNTEQDGNDLTYFLLHHLKVIERSIAAFREYLDRKTHERMQLAQAVLPAIFNSRQQAILITAQKRPETTFTYQAHAHAHQVTLATARTDLLELEDKGLLRGNRVGRRFEFFAVPELEDKLRTLAEASG